MPFTGLERWDAYPEQTAVTSNPAAGVLSVDVKTFTGRGRVSYIACTCLADGTAATRYISAYKISGAQTVTLAFSATFVASATGALVAGRNVGTGAWNLLPARLTDADFAPGDILRIIVEAGQAGDNISAITYSFKEMR